MKADTRIFGPIDVGDDKVITLENGMIGFPELQKFALIFDEEKGRENSSVMWLQSMDNPAKAFPVVHPEAVCAGYAPEVGEDLLEPLGEMTRENTYVLVTVTASPDPKKTTVNLKAPIVINTETNRGSQIIVDGDYPVKYNVYEAVHGKKEAGE